MSRSMAVTALSLLPPLVLALGPVLVQAQDTQQAQSAAEPVTAGQALINAQSLWGPAPEPEDDPCAELEETDPDVIVVCRQSADPARFMFERRVRADRSTTAGGAPRAPDFDDSCLHTRGRANCIMLGSAPPPAIMVDFDALPETPAGSEAARLYGGPTTDDEAAEAAAPQAPDSAALARQHLQAEQGMDDEVVGP